MSLADGPGDLVYAHRIREVYADRDAERMALLDLVIKRGCRCHHCGAFVAETVAPLHPGTCVACHEKGIGPNPEMVDALERLRKGSR